MATASELERYLVRETYAAHQVFMNVGYLADEIFVQLGPGVGEAVDGSQVGGRHCLSVRLERGPLDFTLLVAPVPEEEGEAFLRVWDEFVRSGKRGASLAELDALLYGSHVYRRHVELVGAMVCKGFEITPLTVLQ